HAQQALATTPDDTLAKIHLGFSRYEQGRYREGLEISLSAEREPSSWCNYQVALCQIRLGDLDGAAKYVDRGARRFPGDPAYYSLRGLLAACRGDADTARQQAELTIRNRRSFGHYHHAQYDIACIHAVLGDKESALDTLDEAAHNGFPCHSFFERDPLLESLRGEARFVSLMKELRTECDGYRRLYRELQSSPGSAG